MLVSLSTDSAQSFSQTEIVSGGSEDKYLTLHSSDGTLRLQCTQDQLTHRVAYDANYQRGPRRPGIHSGSFDGECQGEFVGRCAVTLSIGRDVTRCSVRGDHIVIHSVPYCLRVRDVVMKEINLKQRESCSIQVIAIVPTGLRGDKGMVAH